VLLGLQSCDGCWNLIRVVLFCLFVVYELSIVRNRRMYLFMIGESSGLGVDVKSLAEKTSKPTVWSKFYRRSSVVIFLVAVFQKTAFRNHISIDSFLNKPSL
jgi:hypothetical protein